MKLLKKIEKGITEMGSIQAIIKRKASTFDKAYSTIDAPKIGKAKFFLSTLNQMLFYGVGAEENARDISESESGKSLNFDWYYNSFGVEGNRVKIHADYLISRIVFGMRGDEYFRNELYNLDWADRKQYSFRRKKNKMMALCNKSSVVPEIDDKNKFNINFASFLKRDWVDLEHCGLDDLAEFNKKHSKGFLKYSDGLQGIGARIIEFSKINLESFFSDNKGKKIVIEEIISQHKSMAEFNSSTVNTLRVVTFVKKDGTVEFLGAALRLGRAGNVADNFHMHGIAANIDIDTGVVNTNGVDSLNRRYDVHPDSEKKIQGFVVPHWDMVKEECIKAALMYPEVRYVGWDVAVRENDICFVEGNSTSCSDVLEMPSKSGLWKKIGPLLEEIQ